MSQDSKRRMDWLRLPHVCPRYQGSHYPLLPRTLIIGSEAELVVPMPVHFSLTIREPIFSYCHKTPSLRRILKVLHHEGKSGWGIDVEAIFGVSDFDLLSFEALEALVNYPSAKASGLPVSTISSCSHSENGFVEEEISTGVNFLRPGGIEN